MLSAELMLCFFRAKQFRRSRIIACISDGMTSSKGLDAEL